MSGLEIWSLAFSIASLCGYSESALKTRCQREVIECVVKDRSPWEADRVRGEVLVLRCYAVISKSLHSK